MQYAIVSDIHANLQAWNAVLLDIRSMRIDAVICLGDIVGYGPNPKEVLESVYTNVDHFVLGNHDAVLCGKMDEELFSDNARLMIDWTRRKLGARAVNFFDSLPLSLKGDGFRCAHGDFAEPGCFNYISEPEDAIPSWKAVDDTLLFNGHTHQAAIFVMGQSGTPHKIPPEDFVHESCKKFIVNAGSVGRPRDGDPRASYCIFDNTEKSVCWRRIPFDIDACIDAMKREGVPCGADILLDYDPRQEHAPLRELVDFSPSKSVKVKNAIEVQDINVLQKQVKKWRAFSAIAIAALMCAGICGFIAWENLLKHPLTVHGIDMTPVSAAAIPAAQNILPPPGAPESDLSGLPGWDVRLGNRKKQAVTVKSHENTPAFEINSSDPRAEIELLSIPVEAEQGTKFTMEAMFFKKPEFSGSIVAVVILTRESGGDDTDIALDEMRSFVVKEATLRRKGGWELAKHTFVLPANSKSIRAGVRGKFNGTVMAGNISLVKGD